MRPRPGSAPFPHVLPFRASDVNALLSSLNAVTYTPASEYEGADTLHVSATSTDGSSVSTAAKSTSSITGHADAEDPTFTPAAAAKTLEEMAGAGRRGSTLV